MRGKNIKLHFVGNLVLRVVNVKQMFISVSYTHLSYTVVFGTGTRWMVIFPIPTVSFGARRLNATGNVKMCIRDRQKTPDYRFAVRTNVLYDAFLLPTVGVEWRMNENVGIKLDGSLAWWGGNHGKVQKMWLVNPEVRWYLPVSYTHLLVEIGSKGRSFRRKWQVK